jgi:hypothetical protein
MRWHSVARHQPKIRREVADLANAQVHAQVVLLLSISIRTLGADLWSIRSKIRLENNDSRTDPPLSEWPERTRPKAKSVPNQLLTKRGLATQSA